MRSFSETQPEYEKESDRVPLKPGMKIAAERIVLSDKTKYKIISKIDGYLLSSKTPGKWYTTSDVIGDQLTETLKHSKVDSEGVLAEPFAFSVQKKGKNGYLMLADPD